MGIPAGHMQGSNPGENPKGSEGNVKQQERGEEARHAHIDRKVFKS